MSASLILKAMTVGALLNTEELRICLRNDERQNCHLGSASIPTARIERPYSYISSFEGGLEGLPLRVSNEGLPRPRVARAQETIEPAPAPLVVPPFTPYTGIFAIQPGLNSPARSFTSRFS